LQFFHRTASDNLTGTLYVCGAAQGDQHFSVRGNVGTEDASRFQLGVSVADSAAADGLAPRTLRGTWDGRDSLDVNADLYVRYRGQAVSLPHASETTRPQPGALHRADSAEFRTLWNEHEVGLQPPDVKRFDHPEVGPLELQCQTLLDPDQSHRLLVYTAMPGSDSYAKLQLLAVIGAQTLS